MTRFTKAVSLFAGAILFVSACDRATDVAAPEGKAFTARASLTNGIVTWSGTTPMFRGFGTATVDGALSPGEWDPSASVNFTVNLPGGGTSTGTLYIMNDHTDLYFAVEVPNVSVNWSADFQVIFDDNDDGIQQFEEDIIRAFKMLSSGSPAAFIDGELGHAPPQPPCGSAFVCHEDLTVGGTVDGSAAITLSGSVAVIEMSHPLVSGDQWDFKLAIGDTVGFLAGLNLFNFPSQLGQSGFPNGSWGRIVILDTASPSPLPPPPLLVPPDTGTVVAGQYHTCGIETTGRAWCWGANKRGAVGDASNIDRNFPVKVRPDTDFVMLSAGAADTSETNGHTCGLRSDGTAFCWGDNRYGQLGTGGTTATNTSTLVLTTELFIDISAGRSYSCGVTSNNVGMCWGKNDRGQFGDGSVVGSLLPTPVGSWLKFLRISAGDVHTCGITTSFDLYCWGENGLGQLGLGAQSAPQLKPAFVGSGFYRVSTGADHTCAINLAHELYCWGANHHGQVGDGTGLLRTKPVRVGIDYMRVDVGGSSGSFADHHSCGVQFSGDAFCWGSNSHGEVGNGLPPGAPITTPTAVVGGLLFRNVTAGRSHSCGVTFTAEAYCWGSNKFGELGIAGGPGSSSTPWPVRIVHSWY